MSTVSFTFRMDSEVKTKLEEEAKHHERSAAFLVNQLIKNYFESKEAEKIAVKKALEEANKGVFVSSETMGEWFASLGSENELPRPKADVFLTTANK